MAFVTAAVTRYQRSWLTWTWIAAFGAVPLATAGYGILHQLGAWGGPTSPNPWALGCLAAWAAIGLVAGTRSAMVSVVATPDELIIRNFLSTRRIPWGDIDRIERSYRRLVPVAWGWGSALANLGVPQGLRVRLRNGTTVVATAYAPAGGDSPDFADHVIRDLRRYLGRAAAREAAGPPS